MKPFSVQVEDAVLDDLRRRLADTRWPDEPPGAGWEQGAPLAHVQALAERWRAGFDWRRAEAALNALAQYTAPLSGIDLHFIAEGETGPPVVCLHGWPSSVWEFHRLVPRLRDQMQVVVPSLPGYGFSFAPGQRRFGIVDCAEAIHALMTDVLGHERYLVVGGDWGASIGCRLAARGGRLRGHPGQEAADAGLRAVRLAGRAARLDRREVRGLDRREPAHGRRPRHGHDLLGHGRRSARPSGPTTRASTASGCSTTSRRPASGSPRR